MEKNHKTKALTITSKNVIPIIKQTIKMLKNWDSFGIVAVQVGKKKYKTHGRKRLLS